MEESVYKFNNLVSYLEKFNYDFVVENNKVRIFLKFKLIVVVELMDNSSFKISHVIRRGSLLMGFREGTLFSSLVLQSIFYPLALLVSFTIKRLDPSLELGWYEMLLPILMGLCIVWDVYYLSTYYHMKSIVEEKLDS